MSVSGGSVVNTVVVGESKLVVVVVVGLVVVVVVVVGLVVVVVGVVVVVVVVVVVWLIVVVVGKVVVTRDIEVAVVGSVAEVFATKRGTGGVPHWTVTADHADTTHHRRRFYSFKFISN